MIPGYGLDLPQHGVDHAWRNDNTDFVVEQNVHVAVPVARSRDLADGVEWAIYVGQAPPAINLAVGPGE